MESNEQIFQARQKTQSRIIQVLFIALWTVLILFAFHLLNAEIAEIKSDQASLKKEIPGASTPGIMHLKK